jgi:hypothetical protein
MERIQSVFAKGGQLDRRIEKVIQYDMRSEEQLHQEVNEYIVTDNIRHNFEKLLNLIDRGIEEGSNEIGVWVSGFYGSGKSSFTKYFGFALDQDRKIGDKPFLDYLQDRFESKKLQQRLSTVAKKHDPTVLMLDLASEQLAGATMAEISSVLYAKVMQWAGYSRDRKIAYLELMLEQDGKLKEFEAEVEERRDTTWEEVKDQPLVANRMASDLAHKFYPDIFRDEDALQTLNVDEMINEQERSEKMIDLIRERSGKENIIFILDEVGQYVASRDSLILNLQGLAQNLKKLGNGKVWIIATAQQTLTEDDPHARVNSAKLFKLKDRFPVGIDLEASDIREICYKRLLGKSPGGEERLKSLFGEHGPKLRQYTGLQNASVYEGKLDEEAFYRLYPFLPQHFTLLLELLGQLSKSTGGAGLRSAIKVVQDVLVDPDSLRDGATILSERPLGHLATTVTFYDTLRRDIDRSFGHVAKGVSDVVSAFGADSIEARVAKTVAILQIVENCPASRENVAALLHPSVDAGPQKEGVNEAVETLIEDETIRINEVDNRLQFLSEKVNDLEDQRKDLVPNVRQHQRIRNEKVREIFTPLPSASIQGSKSVKAGLKLETRAGTVSIEGAGAEIQMVVDFVGEERYDAAKTEYTQTSTQKNNKEALFLLAHDPEVGDIVDEIYKCERIFDQNRDQKTDKEVSDYLNGQRQRAKKLRRDLERKLEEGMAEGSFIFRGRPTAVKSLSSNLKDAAQKQLGEVAEEVYHKFDQAPINPKTTLAEKFLKADLKSISREDDPLGLVQENGQIDTSHAALRSILDYLDPRGQVDGNKLQDQFSQAPYGWSKDALRYLVAGLLTSGEVKLRVGGDDVTVRNSTAVDNLGSNRSFKKIGVALRDQQISNDQLDRASTRLVDLTGEDVMPLEEEIADTVRKFFPQYRQQYSRIPMRLRNLDLPGEERAEELLSSLSEIEQGSAADAASRLGSEDAPLVDDLEWLRSVKQALDRNQVDEDIERATRYFRAIPDLPDVEYITSLKRETKGVREQIDQILQREKFFEHTADLQSHLTTIENRIEETVENVRVAYQEHVEEETERLQNLPEWVQMDTDDQNQLSKQLDDLDFNIPPGLSGLQHYTNARLEIDQKIRRIEKEIKDRAESAPAVPGGDGEVKEGGGRQVVSFAQLSSFEQLPSEFSSVEDIDRVIGALQQLKEELEEYESIVIDW